MPFEDFQKTNAPTWLQGPYGSSWLGGLGKTKDFYTELLRQAVKARFPISGPPDACGYMGDERGIDRGTTESNSAYALRVQGAWNVWPFANAALGLLLALNYAGFPGAVFVQQNGLAYSLSLPIGADPTTSLVITPTSTLANIMTSNVTPLRRIPAGNSWWTFDSNTDLCSRFSILFPTGGGPFTTSGTATFTGVEDGVTVPWPVVNWNNSFPDTTYAVQVGAVYSTDPVSVVADATTKTTGSVGLVASGPFVGTVDVLAYQSGANPWADLHPGDLARLRNIVTRWRRGQATCTGFFVLAQGMFFDWPIRTFNYGGTFGQSVVAQFTP